MNATWAVMVAKAGDEDGSGLIGGSCIVDPNGRIVAQATTLADEIVLAACDLDLCSAGEKKRCFIFQAIAALSGTGRSHCKPASSNRHHKTLAKPLNEPLSPVTQLAALPDISGLRIVRRMFVGRWISVALIVALIALLARAFARGQIEWRYVGRFLLVPAILDGILNTVVMSVLAMALGIALGVTAAVMRMSPNPVLRGVSSGYAWLFRGTPVILQLLLVVQSRAGVSHHRHPRFLVRAHRGCHDAVRRRAARPRHQPGRLHFGGRARRTAVGRYRPIRGGAVDRP